MSDPMSEIHDPYGGCETGCTHDLVRGVLTRGSEQMTWLRFKAYFTGDSWNTPGLLDEDGPYPDQFPLLTSGWLADSIAAAVNWQATASRIDAV